MACLVTRPATPVPGIREMSTRCSAAILRTRGVDFLRRRSWAVWTPPSPFPTGAVGRSGGRAGETAGAGGVEGAVVTAGPAAAGTRWAAATGGAGAAATGGGDAVAGGGAVTAAALSVPITATSGRTRTVWPSVTSISPTRPAQWARKPG